MKVSYLFSTKNKTTILKGTILLQIILKSSNHLNLVIDVHGRPRENSTITEIKEDVMTDILNAVSAP